jgi:putative transposase
METSKRETYTNDLSDEEWAHLRILLPKSRGKGRRRSAHQQRELLNAMYYVVRTGCQWRDLPHDFPAWQTVYSYQSDLNQAGVWQRVNDILRRGVRVQAGKDPEPSVIIVDSQSVKTTEKRANVSASTVAKKLKVVNDISQ